VTRVVLFGATTGYQLRSFGEAAAALGVRLVFASDRCDQLEDPWYDAAVPIRFHEEARAVDAVRRAFAPGAPDGVVGVGDRPVVVAARTAEAFNLPWHPPRGAAVSRNKLETRRALRAAGLPVPPFHAFPIAQDLDALPPPLRYPVVVKPAALSGSRGVMRADTDEALAASVRRLRALLQAPDIEAQRDAAHSRAIVESFIPGPEFALEGVMTRGALTVLAIFDKPDPLDGPVFEETIYVTPSRTSRAVQAAMVAQVSRAAEAIGLWHGPIHAECRVNPDGVFVLEAAARPIGGLCSRAVRMRAPEGPLTLEDVLLRHAIGADTSACRQDDRACGVMMIPIPRRGVLRGVDGLDEARAVAGVDDIRITAKADAVLVPLPEGRSYPGFIFASADDPARVETALREAHRRLRFRIERDVALVPAPDV
jgi:hypothetical protein